VTNWTLVKTTLWHHEVVRMPFTQKLVNLDDPLTVSCLTDGESIVLYCNGLFPTTVYKQMWDTHEAGRP
jgi:hypothetical protein